MPKVNQRVAISKYLLKESLLSLLQKKHISKISISELCQAAEINRTTFYRHYGTPNDVLQEIILDQIEEFAKCASSSTPHDPKEFAYQLCHSVYEHADKVKLLMRNDSDIDYENIFQALSRHFLGPRTILYRGKAMDEGALRLMNTFFCAGIYAIIRQWLTKDSSKTPEEVAELMVSTLNPDFTFQ